MTIQVKVILADDAVKLETLVNVFLATFDPANVLDVDWGLTLAGRNNQVGCFITYQA